MSHTMQVQLGEDARVTLAVTQDVEKNTSSVRVTGLSVRNRSGLNYGSCWLVGDIRVGGIISANLILSNTQACAVTYSNAWDGSGEGGWSGYSCQSVEVTHNADGTAAAEITLGVHIYTTSQRYVEYLSRTAAAELPAIPRASTLAAEAVQLGQPLTLTLNRASETFRDTVSWRCGTESGCLAEKTDALTVSWTPPIALAAQAPAAEAAEITFTVTTFSGENQVGGSSLELLCPIPADVTPTAALTVSDRLGYLQKHGGYIQNQSQALAKVTAAGAYGSSIAAIRIRCGSLTGLGEQVCFALERSGAVTVTAEVTDSRGRTAAVSREITVLPYAKPAPRVERVFRCNSDGSEQADGEYLCMQFAAQLTPVENGTAQYFAVVQVHGGTQTRRVELTDYAGQFQPAGSVVLPAGVDSGYDCCLEAADSFAAVRSDAVPVGVAFVLLDFYREGKSAGIGMRAQGQQRLSIALDTDLTEHRLRNLAAPQSPADAATKQYVDTLIAALRQQLNLPD